MIRSASTNLLTILHPQTRRMRQKQLAQTAFALGMIGLDIVGLVYGDFA